MRNKPRIRFKGFTEDWEQRKLCQITTRVTRKNGDQSDLPLTISAQDGLVDQRKYFNRQVASRDMSNYYLIKKGEFAYNKSYSEGYPFGAVKRLDYYDIGALSTLYILFEITDNNISSDFIVSYYMTHLWYKEISKRAAEGARNHGLLNISTEDFFDSELNIPNSIEEQVKIGNFIKQFDKFITLHQRKLEKLKLAKKALLQKLFPKNGSKFPELRFKGFADAWEQCKLGEIFEYLQNNTLSRDSLNYKNPNIKNIHYGDILVKFDEILDGSNKDIPYINSELDLSKFSKSLLRDGDIIFSDTAEDDTVGKAIELQNVNAPFILGGLHTIPCRPLIPFGKGYLGNFLNSDSYRLQLRPLVQGIKVSSISKSALKDTMIEYPKTLDEQEKIGSLFYYIAKMITLHQRKLDKLQDVKKGLLQKMFV